MKNFESVEQVLDFAIDREIEAIRVYKELAKMIEKPEMKKIAERLAQEETDHKAKLIAAQGGWTMLMPEDVGDLEIADYVDDVELRPDMGYIDLLTFAMKKEKKAYKFYADLAATIKDEKLAEMFSLLAQQEAGHKLRFELEYDLTVS
jgi:rubrerythrin